MTITNGYCTLDEFKRRILGPEANSDPARDADIEKIISDISRLIDAEVHEQFYVDTVATARYFTPRNDHACWTDTYAVITSVKLDLDGDGTYETTLTTADYWASPVNSAAKFEILLKPACSYGFSEYPNSVELTATWGRASTGLVREACILQSSRIYARRLSPMGTIAVGDMGQAVVISTLDPDVQHMLETYKKVM